MLREFRAIINIIFSSHGLDNLKDWSPGGVTLIATESKQISKRTAMNSSDVFQLAMPGLTLTLAWLAVKIAADQQRGSGLVKAQVRDYLKKR
jgi:hypothetical protein